jgi:hypothetical protein
LRGGVPSRFGGELLSESLPVSSSEEASINVGGTNVDIEHPHIPLRTFLYKFSAHSAHSSPHIPPHIPLHILRTFHTFLSAHFPAHSTAHSPHIPLCTFPRTFFRTFSAHSSLHIPLHIPPHIPSHISLHILCTFHAALSSLKISLQISSPPHLLPSPLCNSISHRVRALLPKNLLQRTSVTPCTCPRSAKKRNHPYHPVRSERLWKQNRFNEIKGVNSNEILNLN